MGSTESGPLGRWWAGWRVSLRMARRDVRRHRGRSLLVVVLVGVPVLLLTAATTLWSTDELDAAERLPLQLGASQGFVLEPQPFRLQQLLDPTTQQGGAPDPVLRAAPVPGFAGAGTEGPALARLLGGRVAEVTSAPASFRVGTHHVSGLALGADLSSPRLLAPRVSLTSGRWPTGPGEALVTPDGLRKGLPASGELGLRLLGPRGESAERTLRVVGVGRGYSAPGASWVEPSDVVTTSVASDYATRAWLVDRARPITWPEVERLNTYGIGVLSRYVLEHPDTVTRAPTDATSHGTDTRALVSALAAVALVGLTSLMAGPAFAIGAARQRRSLALAASNGATTGQLRRTVISQALVLGVLSALAGTVLGVAGGVGAVLVTRRLRPDLLFGPLDVPWASVTMLSLGAVVSSLAAAVAPSRGLGRLDVLSVLRGQAVSPRLRRRVPLSGAVLVAAGAATVTWASYRRPDTTFLLFAGGTLLVVAGALLIVPLVLALVSRGAGRLPLPLRMAARDAGRQRGRATPTVAAIMAGAAVLTVLCIGLQADTTRGARDYEASLPEGQATAHGLQDAARVDDVARAVRAAVPTMDVLVLRELSSELRAGSTVVVAQRPGCTLAQTLPQPIGGDGPAPAGNERCLTIASFGRDMVGGHALQSASLEELSAFLDLTTEQQEAMRAGAVATADPAAVAGRPAPTTTSVPEHLADVRPITLDATDGHAVFAGWSLREDPADTWQGLRTTDVNTVRLPVLHLPAEQWSRLTVLYGSPAAVVTPATARRLGLSPSGGELFARADGGISREDEARASDAARAVDGDAELVVERGYQRDDTVALVVVIGVLALIILVATLIATALTQTENAPMFGTLAAVGATRRTRRALAASQALYLGLLGAVLGVLVGLAPGTAVARVVLSTFTETGAAVLPDSVAVPWLQVLLPVLLVPVVAGSLAWASVRRAPVVVRRAT